MNNLSTFPAEPAQAIAMEYVKSQDLSEYTPTQIAALYLDVFKEVSIAFKSATEDVDGFWTISDN